MSHFAQDLSDHAHCCLLWPVVVTSFASCLTFHTMMMRTPAYLGSIWTFCTCPCVCSLLCIPGYHFWLPLSFYVWPWLVWYASWILTLAWLTTHSGFYLWLDPYNILCLLSFVVHLFLFLINCFSFTCILCFSLVSLTKEKSVYEHYHAKEKSY